MKLKREIFRRGTRMVHRFGFQHTQDPFESQAFDADIPISPSKLSSRSLQMSKDGEYRYYEPQSPISKPGGLARLNGPARDNSDPIAQTVPMGTIERTTMKPKGK